MDSIPTVRYVSGDRARLAEFLWRDREEPFYAVHPTVKRTAPTTKEEALRRLVAGERYLAPVPRIAIGNSKEHCTASFNALWCDLDLDTGIDPLAHEDVIGPVLRPLNLWPSVIVFSG